MLHPFAPAYGLASARRIGRPSSRRTAVVLATSVFLSNMATAPVHAEKLAIKSEAPRATAVAASAATTSLQTVWQAVLANDPELRAFQAERDASGTQRAQAGALWKPTVVLQGTAGVVRQSMVMNGASFNAPGMGSVTGVNFATSVHAGPTARVGIMLQQALFSPARRAQAQQLSLMADLGEATWQSQLTQARLQTAERTLNLALADGRVRWWQDLESTLQRVATEAQDRFALGASPITDTHEANAELAKVRAQRLATQLDADSQRQQLAASSGLRLHGRALLSSSSGGDKPTLSLDEALQAIDQTPEMRRAQLAVALAEQDVARTRAGADTQINLVAQSSHDRLSGHGDFGSATNQNTQHLLGVQATIPLYTGGMQNAQQQSAVAKVAQAEAQRDALRARLTSQITQTWQALAVADARVQALQAALTASRERLNATRLGREVGDRTTLDVLNAENAHANDRWALAEAEGQRVLTGLRLRALAGQMDDETLRVVGLNLLQIK